MCSDFADLHYSAILRRPPVMIVGLGTLVERVCKKCEAAFQGHRAAKWCPDCGPGIKAAQNKRADARLKARRAAAKQRAK